MANDIVKFFAGHQQPSRDKLADAMADFHSTKNQLAGKALLRLTKSGQWVFGADSEAFDTEQLLVANPASMASGYIAWYQGKIEGEVMQPLTMGPVDATKLGPVNSGSVPPGAKQASGRGWEAQSSIDLVTDEDVPLSLIYKVSSLGGMKALLGLSGDIAFGMTEDERRVYPLIKLGTEFYVHNEWGKVYSPVLEVVGWLDAEGEEVVDRPRLSGKGKDNKLL